MTRLRDEHGYSAEMLTCFLQPSGIVLEVGCNQGRNAREIARHGSKVIGVDISAEYLRKVESPVIAVQADAHMLPFRDSTFDYILCSEVLEHLPEPSLCIQECCRVLKAGGTALFACPTLNIPINGLLPVYRKLAGIPKQSYGEHIHVFSSKRLKTLLSHHFEVIDVRYVEFLSVFERRFGLGHNLEPALSSIAAKFVPLRCLAGGAWFRVRKSNF